ncbi:MAG: transposase [Bacillota bacterium]
MRFMETVAEEYREAARILVIWDNLNIHHDGPKHRWSQFNARHRGKFQFVTTPLHASWVNQVEIFFSILQRRCLKHGDFHSTEDLRERVLAFIARWNTAEGHPFQWTFRGYPMQEKAVA